jgi:AraC-like DNA-binding protein
MPTSTGFETATGPNYQWDGRKRGNTPFSILQHSIRGTGRLRYNQRDMRVNSGETMLVTIPHDNRYWLQQDEEWTFFWIAFSGQEAQRLHRAIIMNAGPVFQLSTATIDKLTEICLNLCSVKSAGEASYLAYHATMLLHDDLLVHSDNRAENPGQPEINHIIEFININLSQPLDVQKLAQEAGMSRAHFSRLFKKQTGNAPADYIMQQRMERAAKLLADSRLSVKLISHSCGFKDANYFSKVFRKTFSISPVEFRTTGMFSSVRG